MAALIIGLARYGSLRCRSEVLSLQWQDVDCVHARIRVRSPKTEHHPGKASRLIPLFPELLPILAEAFEAAPKGAEYVVSGNYREACQGPAGWRNVNLRTQFERILGRAGIDPWPRPFHNLRSSRQTELAELFPSHVVCAWLGNSEEIARDPLPTSNR
jgi:integrase